MLPRSLLVTELHVSHLLLQVLRPWLPRHNQLLGRIRRPQQHVQPRQPARRPVRAVCQWLLVHLVALSEAGAEHVRVDGMQCTVNRRLVFTPRPTHTTRSRPHLSHIHNSNRPQHMTYRTATAWSTVSDGLSSWDPAPLFLSPCHLRCSVASLSRSSLIQFWFCES